jgi:isoleucyl-tRNA synthetase
MTSYKKVNLKQSFPDLENEINAFWKKNNIFEESIATRGNAPEFNFYDGPPFAT